MDEWTDGRHGGDYNIPFALFKKKLVFLFVCFVALRPKSTAMVMAVNQYFVHILSLLTDNPS